MQDHPTNATPNVPATPQHDEFELWDLDTVRRFFGGVHRTTIDRGIGTGRYPAPMNISDNAVRWIAQECRDALVRMRGERGTKPRSRRGRPPHHLKIV